MAQIRESRFSVIGADEEEIDLIDLAGQGGLSVETEHEYYSDELEEEISELSSGDVIDAMIQGEDILQPNGLWRFIQFTQRGHDPELGLN